MSKTEQEILLSEDNLVLGVQVEYMSRDCEIVGFEDDYVLLHSLHKQPNGKPTSSWKVKRMNLIGRSLQFSKADSQ